MWKIVTKYDKIEKKLDLWKILNILENSENEFSRNKKSGAFRGGAREKSQTIKNIQTITLIPGPGIQGSQGLMRET